MHRKLEDPSSISGREGNCYSPVTFGECGPYPIAQCSNSPRLLFQHSLWPGSLGTKTTLVGDWRMSQGIGI